MVVVVAAFLAKHKKKKRIIMITMMEVVFAKKGYFCLSKEAMERLGNQKSPKRWDPTLVGVVKELGRAAAGEGCVLEIAEVAANGGCYVVYPSGEWIFDSLKEAMHDTWDWELDVVSFKYGLKLSSRIHRRYRAVVCGDF